MRWWPRRRRPDPDTPVTWAGPPAPLPGGAPRNGDAWSTPLAQVLDEPTLLLPLLPGPGPMLTPGQAHRGGGWRTRPDPFEEANERHRVLYDHARRHGMHVLADGLGPAPPFPPRSGAPR